MAKESRDAADAASAQHDLESEIEALLLELVRGVAAHLYMARQEVEQTRAILDDAVERLMPVFSVWHRRLDSGNPLAGTALAAELDTVVRRALPAMQFHDISSQLLAHIRERFDTLLSELERLSRGIGAGSDARDAREMATHFAGMRSALAESLAALDRRLRKPVDQDSMASGDVEPF